MYRIVILLLLYSLPSMAQTTLTIEESLAKAEENFPLLKQRKEIETITHFSNVNASSAYLPQLELNAQATYQSDVTQVPIHLPNVEIPTISKDQYKATLDVRQTIFDGGMSHKQKQLNLSNKKVEQQKIEVDLFKLKSRITQLFFNILLAQQSIELAQLLNDELENKIRKTEAGVKNGVALKSNLNILKAESLKNEQRIIELRSAKNSLLQSLSTLIGQELSPEIALQQPADSVLTPIDLNNRPEIKLLDDQKELLHIQSGFYKVKNTPKLSAFFQGGYGRPALNFLKNDFQFFYITGIKLNWLLWNWNTSKNEQKIIVSRQNMVTIQREDLMKNLEISLNNYKNDIQKLRNLIDKDHEIIELRSAITKSASVQLENGVITPKDYLSELNAENQARQNLSLHEIQLSMTLVNYKIESGNL